MKKIGWWDVSKGPGWIGDILAIGDIAIVVHKNNDKYKYKYLFVERSWRGLLIIEDIHHGCKPRKIEWKEIKYIHPIYEIEEITEFIQPTYENIEVIKKWPNVRVTKI